MAKCPTCGRDKKRTLPQNARLHALITEIAANVKAKDGLYHHTEWWKVMFKDRWLGYEEFTRPDGVVITKLKSTADCDVDELNEFMTKVEVFAAEKGIWVEE